MIPDLNNELKEFIQNISNRNMYGGNKIPESIMSQFEIEETPANIGVLVPYWLSVLQVGRGPRKSTKSSNLWKIIYRWMERRSLFKSHTPAGRVNEAKSLTWYINKYGNKHFRSKVFVDIYKIERENLIELVDEKFKITIDQITMEVI